MPLSTNVLAKIFKKANGQARPRLNSLPSILLCLCSECNKLVLVSCPSLVTSGCVPQLPFCPVSVSPKPR